MKNDKTERTSSQLDNEFDNKMNGKLSCQKRRKTVHRRAATAARRIATDEAVAETANEREEVLAGAGEEE